MWNGEHHITQKLFADLRLDPSYMLEEPKESFLPDWKLVGVLR